MNFPCRRFHPAAQQGGIFSRIGMLFHSILCGFFRNPLDLPDANIYNGDISQKTLKS